MHLKTENKNKSNKLDPVLNPAPNCEDFTFAEGVQFETKCLRVQRLRELMSLWWDECRGHQICTDFHGFKLERKFGDIIHISCNEIQSEVN